MGRSRPGRSAPPDRSVQVTGGPQGRARRSDRGELDPSLHLLSELDYFEQLAALERVGAFDFELIKLLLGSRLIERWELWEPAINALGDNVYPSFQSLVERMRVAVQADAST